jgi:hypothetical protein
MHFGLVNVSYQFGVGTASKWKTAAWLASVDTQGPFVMLSPLAAHFRASTSV